MMSETIESFRSMCLTKNQRDEYLVEIRKKKNEDLIHQKRHMRLDIFGGPPTDSLIQEEILTEKTKFSDAYIKNEQELSFFRKTDQLELIQRRFFEAINTQNWEDLPIILNLTRESITNIDDPVSGRSIIDIGIIPHVLQLLSESFSNQRKLQVEASCLVAQISAGPLEDKIYLIQHNCLLILSQTLLLNNEEVHENAMWTLANIAAEEDLCYRDAILDLGVLKEVVHQLRQPPKRNSYSRTAMWLISNLLRGYPFPSFNEVSVTLPVLAQLIHHTDPMTQHYNLLSLMYLTEEKNESTLREIANYGFVSKIVKLIGRQNQEISSYALHIAGNLATGNIEIKKQLIANNIFQTLSKFIISPLKDMRKEACYILRNVLTDGFRDHENQISKLMPVIIERINDENHEVRLEAVGCILNFVSDCTIEEIQLLVTNGVIDALFSSIKENFYAHLTMDALNILSVILEYGEQFRKSFKGNNPYVCRALQNNAINILQTLQQDNDPNICQRAFEILETFIFVERMEEL